jgi:methylaspartate ammonia-lyase
MTIPKTAISYGTSPVVYIDGQQALNQGYTQDANNFYVWYTTISSTHQVKIQFAASSTSLVSSLGPVLAVGIAVAEIISIFTVIAVRRLRRRPDNA